MDIKSLSTQLRGVKNMTEFARLSGVARATLYRVRNGWSNPTLNTLLAIERQLKRSVK